MIETANIPVNRNNTLKHFDNDKNNVKPPTSFVSNELNFDETYRKNSLAKLSFTDD
jgi:hypothetical protein